MGPATEFLKVEAKTNLFLAATGRSLNVPTMRDREFVNRFCAFHLISLSDYRGDMDDFLAAGLKTMNNLSTNDLTKLSGEFRTTLRNNQKVFGEHAFRKHTDGQTARSVLNASLWDVMATGLCRYPEHIVESRSDALRTAFYGLMENDEFIKAITYSVNDMRKVRGRFGMADQMFKEVFDA
jgi:hypothetical protein